MTRLRPQVSELHWPSTTQNPGTPSNTNQLTRSSNSAEQKIERRLSPQPRVVWQTLAIGIWSFLSQAKAVVRSIARQFSQRSAFRYCRPSARQSCVYSALAVVLDQTSDVIVALRLAVESKAGLTDSLAAAADEALQNLSALAESVNEAISRRLDS